MKNNYQPWVDKNYPTRESQINKCNEAVHLLVSRFSELTVQVGLANRVYHCWARTDEGEIIDPTKEQFDCEPVYTLIAERFLAKDEYEPATGAIFLNTDKEEVGL